MSNNKEMTQSYYNIKEFYFPVRNKTQSPSIIFFFLNGNLSLNKVGTSKCVQFLKHKNGPNVRRLFISTREKFYFQIPQSRIDELLFQEPTTKISALNSKYNCSFAQ